MSDRFNPLRNPLQTLRSVFTNLDAPMPLHRKLYLIARNGGKRVVTLSTCCGHPGEPGC